MHPSLRFTLEKESNSTLTFINVLVYKEATCFLTSVYRKPTFTGLFTSWDSFCRKKRKPYLIKTFVHRALMICSRSKQDCEVSFITEILCNNGFPEDIIRSVIRIKLLTFTRQKLLLARNVLLISGYFGWVISDRFANQISACVRKCYFSSNLRVVFRTRTVLSSGQKDVLLPPT